MDNDNLTEEEKELQKFEGPYKYEEYPAIRYHPIEAPKGRLVETEDEDAELGKGWVKTPADFPKGRAKPKSDIELAE